jgi:CheY-like chemotaxis protein
MRCRPDADRRRPDYRRCRGFQRSPFHPRSKGVPGTAGSTGKDPAVVADYQFDMSHHPEMPVEELPRVTRPAVRRGQFSIGPARAGAAPRTRAAGQGTVLLVEDEPSVRSFVQRSLEQAGFAVIEAPHPEAALQIVERHTGTIDLILSDVVMPGMSGRLMAERLAVRHPEARVLFMSGYIDDPLARRKAAANDVGFLQKPFTPAALIDRVRAILNA